MNEGELRTKRMLVQRLESLQRAGVTQLPKSARTKLEKHSSLDPPAAATPISEGRDSISITEQKPEPESEMAKTKTASRSRSIAASATEAHGATSSPPAPHVVATNPREPVTAKSPAAPTAKSPTIDEPSFADAPLPLAKRKAIFEILQKEVAACTQCHELATTRTQTVFGVGNLTPRVCFFGEAPGADEDAAGEPFVGRAGQLLNKIIEATTLKREDVFILNVLKCRPPGNRTPAVDEVAHCRHFFERQLAVLKPEYIVCAGAVSAQALLNSTAAIGRLRGKFHDFHGMKVLATYHPAYLLRNPAAKKDVWDDMKMLMRDMGIPIPSQFS